MYHQYRSTFFCALVLALAISFNTSAQTKTFEARNALYVEFGGNSGRYAINYSRIIHQKEMLKLNVSAGFSMWNDKIDYQSINNTKWLPVVPLEFSAFWGKSKHHFELGTGITSYLERSFEIDFETNEVSDKVVYSAIIPLRVGYRYQKPEGGFFYRVAYTPFVNLPVGGREDWVFSPIFAALSIGKSF